MAFINCENKLVDKDWVRVQQVGKRPKSKTIKYTVGGNCKPKDYLKAHNEIKATLKAEQRTGYTGKMLKELVDDYLGKRKIDRQEFLELLRVEIPLVREDFMSLHSILLHYQNTHLSDSRKEIVANLVNKKRYSEVLLLFFNSKPELLNLTINHMNSTLGEEYILWRQKYRSARDVRKGQVSRETIKKELTELNLIMEWAADTLKQPLKQLNLKRILPKRIPGKNVEERKALDIEEQNRLLEWARELGDWRVHDSILFLMLTGLRVGEWDKLTPKSFNTSDQYIQVYSEAVGNMSEGKTRHATRTIPLTPTLQRLYERGNIFVKTSQTRGRWLLVFLQRHRGRNCKFNRLDLHVFPHLFRHVTATNWIRASRYSLSHISEYMGHSDTKTTEGQYGKYRPSGMTAGQGQARFTEHLDYLETEYFDRMNSEG